MRDRKISLSVISHVGVRHVALKSESCRASEYITQSYHAGLISSQNMRDRKIRLSVISHVGMRHVALKNDSCRASEHVMSRRADILPQDA